MIKTYQILTNLDCNLRCKYCYEHEKHQGANEIEAIKQYISKALQESVNAKDFHTMKEVAFEFVGGEPFLHIALIKESVEHIISECLRLQQNYLPSLCFSTNGTLFDKSDVRDFIEKYGRYLEIGISIDGTKEVHDSNRVDLYGNGSWSRAVAGFEFLKKNVPLCHINAKATYNHITMDEYAEGVIQLIKLGFKNIIANVVFEEAWTREDGGILYEQMRKVADYLYDNNLLDEVKVMQINPNGSNTANSTIGTVKDKNHCGSCEYMRCLGFDNKIYGCHRFATSNLHPVGELNKSIQIHNFQFIDEVSKQYLAYPKECKDCAFQTLCTICTVVPYENDMPAKEFLARKNICGYTLAIGWTRCYLAQKLQNSKENYVK